MINFNTKELKEFYNKEGYAPHEHIFGFLNDNVFNELLDSFPSDDLFEDEFPETRKLNQRPHCRRFMCVYENEQSPYFVKYRKELNKLPELWQEVCSNMLEPKGDYQRWIKETLQIEDFKIRFDFHRTQSGLDVSPHVDSLGKYGSHLFYFMPEGWQESFGGKTIFYKEKLIPEMNPEPINFKQSTSYPVVGNYSLLFKNVKDGWHGVTQVKSEENLHRQLFNVVILK